MVGDVLSPHAECKKRHGEKEGDEGVMNMLLQKASQSRTSERWRLKDWSLPA
ncbi:MAG: hypothetical protein OJF51_004354 [Nitrospira sp.]|nr:MAG: hypothetical protein OJF51_004354 [Nitrospira sp.]